MKLVLVCSLALLATACAPPHPVRDAGDGEYVAIARGVLRPDRGAADVRAEAEHIARLHCGDMGMFVQRGEVSTTNGANPVTVTVRMRFRCVS